MNRQHAEIESCESYRDVISLYIDYHEGTRGYRTRLAEAAKIHSSFFSNVMKFKADISLEQAASLCDFWELDPVHSEFFITLVLLERAKSAGMKDLYRSRLQELRSLRRKHQQNDTMGLEKDRINLLCSQWPLPVIYAALGIPKLRRSSDLASLLGLSIGRVENALKILAELKLVEAVGDQWALIHSEPINALNRRVLAHHTLRGKAIDVYSSGRTDGIHRTEVFSISKDDMEKLRKVLLDLVYRTTATVSQSSDEEVGILSFDFFRIANQ